MKSRKKSQSFFVCKICDYSSSNKYDYNKHILTLKHKMVQNGTKEGTQKSQLHKCPECDKTYKFRTGLARHRTKIHTEDIFNQSNMKPNSPTLENDAILLLTNALNRQGEHIDKLIKSQNEMIPNIGNNNNNKISINLFLNNECKDAINLDDFVKKLNVTVDDLLKTRDIGYSQGISNIFIKGLNEIETTKRPIHCSDKKRLKFYVKDGEWKKDDGDKIDSAIQQISKKQMMYLENKWKKENPNWKEEEDKRDEYLEILKQVNGGDYTTEEVVKNNKDIVKNIGINTFLNKIN